MPAPEVMFDVVPDGVPAVWAKTIAKYIQLVVKELLPKSNTVVGLMATAMASADDGSRYV